MNSAELVTTRRFASLRRKEVSLGERITPCEFCGYPLSQRHHALPISLCGENGCTLQLCANCHEIYHIVERVYLYKSERSQKLLDAFIQVYGFDDIRLQKTHHFIAAAINVFAEGAD